MTENILEPQVFKCTTAQELRDSVERKNLPTYYTSVNPRNLTNYQKACIAVMQMYPAGIKDMRQIPEMVELVAGILGVEV